MRIEIVFEDAQKELVRTTSYGCLDQILECQLENDNPIWGKFEGAFFLLAVITPCSTGGWDASQCSTSYSGTTVQVVHSLETG
jgi:hypothetical protein